MYQFILMAHSGWRYVVIVVLLVALIKFIVGWIGNREWSNLDTTLSRVTPIVIDIQWLLGLIIWVVGTWWNNGNARVAWVHPIVMTLAVVISHVASTRVARINDSKGKYRLASLAYILIVLLIGVGINAALGNWNLFGSAS